jgi:outer membrane protein TolC
LRQQITLSGAWMDPTFSAEYSNVPIDAPVLGKHPMSGVQLTLRQTIPWPGKISTREDEAKSRVHQEQLGLAEQKVQLRASVRHAYYRLALARQLRAVTARHLKLTRDFLDVVRIKNEAGLAAQHEYLRLRVLADKLTDDLSSFEEDERSLTSVLNAALHRPEGVPVATPERTPVTAPASDASALAGQAARRRPLLQRSTAEAETYRAAARRAARDGYPDITVWAGYRVRTPAGDDMGTDFLSLGVSLPLPLFYDARSGSERRKNEALAQAALETRAADLDAIRGNLGKTIAAWKRAAEQAHTYREQLTPEARLALEATFAAYQVGRAEFSALFQAELELLNFERTTLMAESRAADAQVDVEALVGTGAR